MYNDVVGHTAREVADVLNFVLAAITVIVVISGILGFLAWAIREHLTARKYRYLIRLHETMAANGAYNKVASGPSWKISYREKGKVKEVIIPATTEAEALKEFVKTNGIAYGNIVGSVKL